jgi:hypothetical protein
MAKTRLDTTLKDTKLSDLSHKQVAGPQLLESAVFGDNFPDSGVRVVPFGFDLVNDPLASVW